MKSKLEKNLKNQAWESVPDKWDDIKKEASRVIPEKPVAIKKNINYKTIAAAAASVIVIIGCAVGIKAISAGRVKEIESPEACYVTDESLTTKIQITDENGNTSEVDGYYAYDENSTVILDEKGQVIGKVSNSEVIDENGTVIGTVAETSSKADKSSASADKTTADGNQTTVVETRVEKNWDQKATPEKFSSLKLYSNEYTYTGNVSFRQASSVSKSTELSALDNNDKAQKAYADVYTLSGFSKNLAVGVKFSDSQQYPYVYVNTAYTPATLGDMLDALDWNNSVTYGYINYESIGNFPVSASNVNKYLLADRSLKNQGSRPSGRYVRIDISCDELGLQNKVLDVFENGYIWTNIVGYNFSYYVGTQAVNDFLKASNNITFDEIFAAATNSDSQTINHAVNGTTAGYPEAHTVEE